MGLDMYAYSSNVKEVECEINPEKEIEEQTNELAYWRKHNRLHGWFQNKWEKKVAGMDVEHPFNCVRLYLSRSDLEELEFDLKGKLLPETDGFFFGSDSYADEAKLQQEQLEYDMEFVAQAKKELEEGRHVYYTSWW
jgi:hypothetical protein